jgi:hypothetical protein
MTYTDPSDEAELKRADEVDRAAGGVRLENLEEMLREAR